MCTLQALVPENPQESDADFSDVDDPIEDPDYHPIRDEVAGDSSFESLDEDDAPSTSTSSTELPCKKRRKGKHTLKTVSLQEPEDTLSSPSSPPSGPHNGTRKIWKHEDIEEFQVTESRFEQPVVVQSPFQYFKMLFTDEMIQHVAHQTNLYSAQELGDPIKTSPEEIEDFLAMLLFMGVFNFLSLEDYWHHESRSLLRRYIRFSDNQQCSENPDRFYKIRPLFEMLRKQCLLITNAGIMPLSTVKRWCKESKQKITVPCPSLILAYNQHMGGIYLSDMLVHLYKTPAKSRRWYIPLFGYILDLSIANSWLVYKRDCGLLNEKAMPLKRLSLVKKPASKVGRPFSSSPPPPKKHYTPRPSLPKPQPDVRYDSLGHWPLHCDKRGRWKCQKCNVFLCLNANQDCFAAFHQK
ncbi:hypothetical protein M9458_056888 [Cirrhinus mrigala]|uniref:PiggyBac transposable element-derived protein domain-containing protein n=1 Tax=Cirrhinus mrigala TaxID=683832 RepID=A0ABD0MH40_CIRMR